MSNMNERKEGNNLEEINKNKILNFGDLSYKQNQGIGFYKLEVGWDQAVIKCERCNERIKAKWKDGEWNLIDKEGNEWKVYLSALHTYSRFIRVNNVYWPMLGLFKPFNKF